MQLDLPFIVNLWATIPGDVQIALGRYAIALVLLAVLLIITKWQNIRVGKKLLIGTVRGTIQIILMGLILVYIFNLSDLLIMFVVLTFMGIFAAYTTAANLEKVPGVFKATLPAILVGSLSVMAASVLFGVVEPIGEYVIPMGGMVIGNSMTIASLVIDRMWSNAQKQRSLIETALALGASPFQAVELTIRESLESGLLPNLNRYASLGIVSIPGFMSGMIIGGVNPIVAALLQVVVFIMIFLASVIVGLIISRFFLNQMFNYRLQLTVPPQGSN
ncbi:MAG: iron export ABC transporter permease subunit FetB [Candidatus Thorarchaeota archaeon]|nr:iron export ABC transporter permease subunit FetB [Candidatus Thorarchaeota archaeon]